MMIISDLFLNSNWPKNDNKIKSRKIRIWKLNRIVERAENWKTALPQKSWKENNNNKSEKLNYRVEFHPDNIPIRNFAEKLPQQSAAPRPPSSLGDAVSSRCPSERSPNQSPGDSRTLKTWGWAHDNRPLWIQIQPASIITCKNRSSEHL